MKIFRIIALTGLIGGFLLSFSSCRSSLRLDYTQKAHTWKDPFSNSQRESIQQFDSLIKSCKLHSGSLSLDLIPHDGDLIKALVLQKQTVYGIPNADSIRLYSRFSGLSNQEMIWLKGNDRFSIYNQQSFFQSIFWQDFYSTEPGMITKLKSMLMPGGKLVYVHHVPHPDIPEIYINNFVLGKSEIELIQSQGFQLSTSIKLPALQAWIFERIL